MNVLLISYHFTPEKSGGVGRPKALVKYLPNFGCDVHTVTIDTYCDSTEEPAVSRLSCAKGWRKKGFFFKAFFLKGLSELVSRYFLCSYQDLKWQMSLKEEIPRLIEKHNIDVLYISFPPLDAFIACLPLKARYGLKLVAEFRDGFCFEPLVPLSRLQHTISKKLERKIVFTSDAVITVGNRISEYFNKTYEQANIHTVFNGFDPEDFSALDNVHKTSSKETRIAHFGSMSVSRSRDIAIFFQALKSLLTENVLLPRFKIDLIGNHSREEIALVRELGLSKIINFMPQVEKREGLAMLSAEYDYLLLYGVEGAESVLTAKIFDYIRLGIPIIGICQGNEAEHVIRQTGTGEVAGFSNDEICEVFKKALSGQLFFKPVEEQIQKYNQHYLVGQIADVLKSLS